ncbi:MAG: tetratricopeptide repeat protein [Crocinitomicaceae bacterium]|nr:tetratricopeptide repeat protein [Crocinitomicaceae bacterium]
MKKSCNRLIIIVLLLFWTGGLFASTKQSKYLEKLEDRFENSTSEEVNNCIDSIIRSDRKLYEKELLFFLRNKGKLEIKDNHYTKAFKLFSDALKLAESKDDSLEVAKNKMELGLVFLHFDDLQIANKVLKEAEKIFKNRSMDEEYARSAYLRAILHKRMGKFEESTRILRRIELVYKRIKDTSGLANTYNAIGVNYKNLKKVGRAIKFFHTSIELFLMVDKPLRLAKAYNNLANTYEIDKSWEKSILNYERSLEIKRRLNDTLGIAISYINMSVIYKRKNEVMRSLEYGNRSIALLDRIGERGERNKSKVYHLMSELHEEMGDQMLALKYARLEHELWMKARVKQETTLIELFEKKHDVRFYTISDSLLKSQEILQDKIIAVESEKKKLVKQKSDVLNTSMLVVVMLLGVLVLVIYGRYLVIRRIKNQLEVTNKELYATRISKEEKEVLLQEIHHRVKNNMQIISSLIRLQSNQSDDALMKELFDETQNRINSMALVHEQLYQTKDFEKLELNGYIAQLVGYLVDTYKTEVQITQKIDVSLHKASIDSLIPIGLIVNEIVSNSLKHAFKGVKSGIVSLFFHESKDQEAFILEVSDDGNGGEAKSVKPSSLGLELIDSLVCQLDGDYELSTENGYSYIIRIPKI